MAVKKWIGKAVKRKGRLRRMAARTGGLTPEGTIKPSWLAGKRQELEGRAGAEARSLRSALALAERFKSGEFRRRRPKGYRRADRAGGPRRYRGKRRAGG